MKKDFLTFIRPEIRTHLAKDPVLAGILEQIGDSQSIKTWRIQPVAPADYFYYLSREIVYQQLSGKAAGTIFGRLEALLKQHGHALTPVGILALTQEELRTAGLSRSKALYLHSLAEAVISQLLMFDEFVQYEDSQIIDQLVHIKGIGQWTAEMFLMFAMGRENVFSYGDLGLRKAVKLHYGFEALPSEKEMHPLAMEWSPYRTYAACVLWASLEL